MKKFIVILCFILLQLSSYAQHKETIMQNNANQVGIKTKEDFKQEPHLKWFNHSYENYKLDQKTIEKLKKYTDGITIKVFMSVWCHDSKREVPQLYKILETIGFDEKNIQVIALNRVKKTPENLQEGFNIMRTPTLIFYKNEVEIGRYVEHPRKTLEKDILKIISGRTYKHSYFKS